MDVCVHSVNYLSCEHRRCTHWYCDKQCCVEMYVLGIVYINTVHSSQYGTPLNTTNKYIIRKNTIHLVSTHKKSCFAWRLSCLSQLKTVDVFFHSAFLVSDLPLICFSSSTLKRNSGVLKQDQQCCQN